MIYGVLAPKNTLPSKAFVFTNDAACKEIGVKEVFATWPFNMVWGKVDPTHREQVKAVPLKVKLSSAEQ